MKPWLIWLLLLFLSMASDAQESKPRPEWLGKEPLITVGNWDSMPIFRRRVGGQGIDVEEDYPKRHPSIENVQVSLKLPPNKSARAVHFVSPGVASTAGAVFAASKGSVAFTVPHIRTYTIAVVDLQ